MQTSQSSQKLYKHEKRASLECPGQPYLFSKLSQFFETYAWKHEHLCESSLEAEVGGLKIH